MSIDETRLRHDPATGRILDDEGREYVLHPAADVAAAREEVERLREEVDQACAMFSKYTHRGRLDMPREFHVERGRRMAGLGEEVGRGVGDGVGDAGDVRDADTHREPRP